MALTESREMEMEMRWKVGGFNRAQSGLAATIGRNARHRPKMLSQQKQGLGENSYVGAYNVGKYNGGVPSVVRPWSLGNCYTIKNPARQYTQRGRPTLILAQNCESIHRLPLILRAVSEGDEAPKREKHDADAVTNENRDAR